MITILVDYHNQFHLGLPERGKGFKEGSLLKYLNGGEVTLKNYQYNEKGRVVLNEKGEKVVKKVHKLKIEGPITKLDIIRYIVKTNQYNKSEESAKALDNRLSKVAKIVHKQESMAKMKEHGIDEATAKSYLDYYEKKVKDYAKAKSEKCKGNIQEDYSQIKKELDRKTDQSLLDAIKHLNEHDIGKLLTTLKKLR